MNNECEPDIDRFASLIVVRRLIFVCWMCQKLLDSFSYFYCEILILISH